MFVEVGSVAVTVRLPVSTAVSAPVGAVNARLTVQEFAGVDALFSTNGEVGQVPPGTTAYVELLKVRLKVNAVTEVLVTVKVCVALVAPAPASAKSNDAGDTVGR
jgi:hypothetical protein